MINLRVFVRGSLAVAIMLAQIYPIVDAHARDIRWLREEQGAKGREQSQRQAQEPWQPRQQRGAEQTRRPEQRMSEDERQQLRRDIRDAGREIYPPRR